jgi:spermidine synthase
MTTVRAFEAEGTTLVLREQAGRVDVLLGNVVLLSSAALETELAFGRIAPPGAARVVVGGLGFAATVRGVLEVVANDAQVVVVEKVGAIEALVRGELAYLAQGALEDARVEVRRADVADVVAAADPGSVDAILLDVDNGPEWASFRTNARLYAADALARACTALRPGGLLAVWSGYAADGFQARLRKAGLVPTVVPLREKGVVRARAYVGTRPGPAR